MPRSRRTEACRDDLMIQIRERFMSLPPLLLKCTPCPPLPKVLRRHRADDRESPGPLLARLLEVRLSRGHDRHPGGLRRRHLPQRVRLRGLAGGAQAGRGERRVGAHRQDGVARLGVGAHRCAHRRVGALDPRRGDIEVAHTKKKKQSLCHTFY